MVVDETHDNADDFERLATLDEEWPDTYEERTKPSSARIEEQGDRQHDTMANMVSRPVTLQDHLHEQLSYFDLDDDVRGMCDRIIYNLDKNGYFQGRIEDMLDSSGGTAQLAIAKKALAIVQKLDPLGWAHAICANACCSSFSPRCRTTMNLKLSSRIILRISNTIGCLSSSARQVTRWNRSKMCFMNCANSSQSRGPIFKASLSQCDAGSLR